MLKAKSFTQFGAPIDERALSFFRIGLGSIILLDLLNKTTEILAFFSDKGIFPIALNSTDGKWWDFSLHNFSGDYSFQLVMMVLGLVLSAGYTIGFKTKWVAPLLWLFTLSLHNKNPLILHGGDGLTRLLLFWSMFLNLSARYSVDSYLQSGEGALRRTSLLASHGIRYQILSMYVFTALLKSDPVWTRDFTALYYVLNLEAFSTGLGRWLLQFPIFLKFLTASTYALELVGPLVYLLPYRARQMRVVLPLLFISFHFMLFLTMFLGTFPWVCMVSWILFLPTHFWDACGTRIGILLPRKPTQVMTESALGKWGRTVFLSICMLAVTVWNVYTLPTFGRTPDPIRYFVLPLRLDQNWSMFAPKPMMIDGWLVAEGILTDKTPFDPWNGSKVIPWTKPDNLFKAYRSSSQWRKYINNVFTKQKGDAYVLAFSKYLCRERNSLGPKSSLDPLKLESFEIFYLKERTPNQNSEAVVDMQRVWVHDCKVK